MNTLQTHAASTMGHGGNGRNSGGNYGSYGNGKGNGGNMGTDHGHRTQVVATATMAIMEVATFRRIHTLTAAMAGMAMLVELTPLWM